MSYVFYSNHAGHHTPRATVVGELVDGVLQLAVSRCSAKDAFVKKRGRGIALGRLKKGRIFRQVAMPEGCSSKEFVAVATEVSAEVINNPGRL